MADGEEYTSHEKIVAVDEENKSITYSVYGGSLMKLYKQMDVTVQATTKCESNILSWIYEYEKLNDSAPGPEMLVGFITRLTNVVDAYILNKYQPE